MRSNSYKKAGVYTSICGLSVFGLLNCGIVNAGNNLFNFYNALFHQTNGRIGISPKF